MDELEKVRRNAIAVALEDYNELGSRRTETITFRGSAIQLEVIRVDPKHLLLNSNNSRLRAQLLDDPDGSTVLAEPNSAQSQALLRKLLSETPEFKALKEELREYGQQFPGIISRDGLLINGNTRVAALLSLQAEGVQSASGVDVALLPKGALSDDFIDLEIALQMRQFTQQDYSFTNRLLLIKSYIDNNHSLKELASRMGWRRRGEARIQQNLRLLELVEDIRTLTKPPLNYTQLDSREQYLLDLDDKYQALVRESPSDANQLKYSRVLGMFLGLNKDRTRVIDETFFEDRVVPKLDSPEARAMINEHQRINVNDDFVELLGDGGNTEQIDMRALTVQLFETASITDGTIDLDQNPICKSIFDTMYVEAVESIRRQNLQSISQTPIQSLTEIRSSLEMLTEQLTTATTQGGLDKTKFDFELKKVEKLVAKLRSQYEREVVSD